MRAYTKKHICGGFGYAVGSHGQSVLVLLECKRWDCEECGKRLTVKWMKEINENLRGSVLYTASTKKQGKELSERIRRLVKKPIIYFCAHLDNGALVFSNAQFEGANPRNRKKILGEIKMLMESGKVKGMSRRQRQRDAGYTRPPQSAPWMYARITEDIKPEYDKCKPDYEIGKFLLKYRYTDKIRSLTKLGKELLRKIETGEINEFNG